MLETAALDSPVGPLTVAAAGGRVCVVAFGAGGGVERFLARWFPAEAVHASADPGGAVAALTAYFAGDLEALDALPVALLGTPFQKRVWEAVRRIPAGTTSSYAEVARAIGAPSAVRAVGAANGANPVALVVPCHRVIGSNRQLTGYGGGLDKKRALLAHESARLF